MYDLPEDLDLSPVIGEFTTQLRIGQFSLQFTLGEVSFAIHSPVKLIRDGAVVGVWDEGRWPDPAFYDIMNTTVQRCDIFRGEHRIEIEFDTGITLLLDTSLDDYETLSISFEGKPGLGIGGV